VFENRSDDNSLGIYFIGNVNDATFVRGTGIHFRGEHKGSCRSRNCDGMVRSQGHGEFLFPFVVVSGVKFKVASSDAVLPFSAVGVEETAGPIELKYRGVHGNEHVWIKGGHRLHHYIVENHEFASLGKKSNVIFDILFSRPSMTVVVVCNHVINSLLGSRRF